MKKMLTLLALVLLTAGFRGCSPEQQRTAEENVLTGLTVAARSIAPGAETVRALRESGKIEPATSLKLARAALDVNSAAKRLTEAALGGSDATALAEQLDVLLNLASDLERDGTLRIKNEDTKLVFRLGVLAGRNGLVIARGELKGAGVEFAINAATKEKLRALLPVFDENDRLLREAVARLSQ